MSEPTPHASEAAAARPEVLDPATLEQLLALDDGALGLLGEMAQIFQDDTPPRLAALEPARVFVTHFGAVEDVARHARESVPTMPVVYVSGDSAGDWAVQGVPNSVMIPKPYAFAQIVTAVSTLMNAPDQLLTQPQN